LPAAATMSSQPTFGGIKKFCELLAEATYFKTLRG